MKINIGRGVIEQLVHKTALPNASEVKAYSSQFYPTPSFEAIERARKNNKNQPRPAPGPPPEPATVQGAKLYKDGEPWSTILLEASKYLPGFSELDPDQQEKVLPALKETIKKYVIRHKIHRPKRKKR
jgi:hypothetical protein